MKLSNILAVTLATLTQADFHVGSYYIQSGQYIERACPSNYFECRCLRGGDRAGRVIKGHPIPPSTYFKLASICGSGTMDFYKREGNRWEFYISGGNGARIGECWPNKAEVECTGGGYVDRLACYSYICGR